MDDELHPVVGVVVVGLAGTILVLSTWCTIIVFVGGTIPILGWHMEGSIAQGLLWLFIVDPIVVTIGYWIATIITLPLAAIFKR